MCFENGCQNRMQHGVAIGIAFDVDSDTETIN